MHDREELPCAGDAFERLLSDRGKGEARSGYEIFDRLGNDYFTRSCVAHDSRGEVNGESTYVVIAEFNLACVESGADFDAELASAYGDGLAATYGAGRAIKRGEDAVPGCLHEAAPLMLTESGSVRNPEVRVFCEAAVFPARR